MSHAWLPSSGCGAGCVPTLRRGSGAVRAIVRAVAVAVTLSALPLVLVPARVCASARARLWRGYARALLRAFGLRLRIRDDRGTAAGGASLLVAGHVSWADVLAVSAVCPVSFVARADLMGWPLIGALARRIRVIPIDRAGLRSLPAVVDTAAGALRSGRSVAVFPEGTTWCGLRHGAFAPALFQAAVDAGVPVQPVALRYVDDRGRCTTVPCFVGDETMPRALLRMLRSRPVTVEVRLAPPVQTVEVGPDDDATAPGRRGDRRRTLAGRVQDVVLAA
ncbi:1-acyl-sn-glycerol-3-phosphate acyltransferase [Rhodococcus sp. D2-41]|uniref:1-acyl-sn-glycerol-3-phosphate acyltransferase n=1 Tax=Speluncibacter jeojiensis TaxID=2710754 RepID=A0A9X4RJE7_9ACTN|nr:lysophospholipid acyltransferase family protein [Rhodococcus sp. D2-41]MDG3012789.1 1-acyl-sn-glycerol-3-phosphate acyltransferase [Rhodococcus sp. D2-41]MDG3017106.1 1-acyl-sn-glycerol-3-phosphate acyltransferase [Corynebacteriales bacterium D3-21]